MLIIGYASQRSRDIIYRVDILLNSCLLVTFCNFKNTFSSLMVQVHDVQLFIFLHSFNITDRYLERMNVRKMQKTPNFTVLKVITVWKIGGEAIVRNLFIYRFDS